MDPHARQEKVLEKSVKRSVSFATHNNGYVFCSQSELSLQFCMSLLCPQCPKFSTWSHLLA